MSFYYELDSSRRIDNVVVAVHQLIAFDGLLCLRLRRVAACAGMSPASLNQHYGSWSSVLDRVARRTAEVRWHHLSSQLLFRGIAGYLPDTPYERASMRVWLALTELGRGSPALGAALAELPRPYASDPRDAYARAVLPVDSPLVADDDLVELVLVFAEGIGAALCHPVDPLPVERARTLIRRFETAFGLPRP